VDECYLAPLAITTVPLILMPVLDGKNCKEIELDCYELRRLAMKLFDSEFGEYKAYIVSMSTKTIIYKGMVKATVLP
jgi:glutamate synthase domain-containing protein 1